MELNCYVCLWSEIFRPPKEALVGVMVNGLTTETLQTLATCAGINARKKNLLRIQCKVKKYYKDMYVTTKSRDEHTFHYLVAHFKMLNNCLCNFTQCSVRGEAVEVSKISFHFAMSIHHSIVE